MKIGLFNLFVIQVELTANYFHIIQKSDLMPASMTRLMNITGVPDENFALQPISIILKEYSLEF